MTLAINEQVCDIPTDTLQWLLTLHLVRHLPRGSRVSHLIQCTSDLDIFLSWAKWEFLVCLATSFTEIIICSHNMT